MTAQAKPQVWMGTVKTTLFAALRVFMIVGWVFLGLFIGIPMSRMVVEHWSRTLLWHELSGKTVTIPPPPTPAPVKAKTK